MHCHFEDRVTIIWHPDPVVLFPLDGDSGNIIVSAALDGRTYAYKAKDFLFTGGVSAKTWLIKHL